MEEYKRLNHTLEKARRQHLKHSAAKVGSPQQKAGEYGIATEFNS
jgi:hypothetical protein